MEHIAWALSNMPTDHAGGMCTALQVMVGGTLSSQEGPVSSNATDSRVASPTPAKA